MCLSSLAIVGYQEMSNIYIYTLMVVVKKNFPVPRSYYFIYLFILNRQLIAFDFIVTKKVFVVLIPVERVFVEFSMSSFLNP